MIFHAQQIRMQNLNGTQLVYSADQLDYPFLENRYPHSSRIRSLRIRGTRILYYMFTLCCSRQ